MKKIVGLSSQSFIHGEAMVILQDLTCEGHVESVFPLLRAFTYTPEE